MSNTKPGLKGKSYSALFRSDTKPERVSFEVAGKPCWVDLQRLSATDRDEFARCSGQLEGGTPDVLKAKEYLVARTVVGYCLWARPTLADGTLGDWQQVVPPEGTDDILEPFRSRLQSLPEWWDDLAVECSRVNGFMEEDQGN
jgi:hypothetical protein